MSKTGSFKAIIVPAVLTTGLVWADIGIDFAGVVAVIAILLGLAHQVIDSMFMGVIEEGRTEITQRMWIRMQADEELWSLRANIWISIVLAIITMFVPGANAVLMFLALCILVGLWRYLGHKDTYNLHLLGVSDFTGDDDE